MEWVKCFKEPSPKCFFEFLFLSASLRKQWPYNSDNKAQNSIYKHAKQDCSPIIHILCSSAMKFIIHWYQFQIYFIIFFCSIQCIVKSTELETNQSKCKEGAFSTLLTSIFSCAMIGAIWKKRRRENARSLLLNMVWQLWATSVALVCRTRRKIGRASCRERV